MADFLSYRNKVREDEFVVYLNSVGEKKIYLKAQDLPDSWDYQECYAEFSRVNTEVTLKDLQAR